MGENPKSYGKNSHCIIEYFYLRRNCILNLMLGKISGLYDVLKGYTTIAKKLYVNFLF